MAIAIRSNHLLMYLLTLFSLTVAFIALFPAARLIPRIIDPLFIIDGMGIFSAGLILAATMVLALLSYGYFAQRESRREEYDVLLVVAVLGSVVLVLSFGRAAVREGVGRYG